MENKSNEFAELRKSETARMAEAMLRGETPVVKSEPVEMNRTEADRLREVQETYRQMKLEEAEMHEGKIIDGIKRFFTGGNVKAEIERERAAKRAKEAKGAKEDEERLDAKRREREALQGAEDERQSGIRRAKDDTETFQGSRLEKDDFGNWQSEPTGKLHRRQTDRGRQREREARGGEQRDGSVWQTDGGNWGAMHRGVRRYFGMEDEAQRYARSGY